ncbi:hypothetical protein [Prochlorococcus marinus]|uniref:Uncharacterized protein n=1 Tax=Prochlorococcus marinus str. GP2 TaxID=59925 RepID=A0A0A1ZHN8_PROMR|nr:hypothetical protein [Prochlorococcus marinus]KGF87734.1 hypothetical protein EU91_0767 [Prochlorococcus marinus str. GP2]
MKIKKNHYLQIMRLVNVSLFLLALVIFGDKSLSLTNYQIKKFCEKEKNQQFCIKNLKEKKSKLEKGYLIEIPVSPYRK